MYYSHDPKLEAGHKEYERIKEQLKNKEQLQESPPTVSETNLVYYINHLKAWIEEQNKQIANMQEVFNGIRKYTRP